MAHIPSLGYSHCQVIPFDPFVFYPDKSIEVQITVNHMDTSDKSYVHDAAVSWIENVNNGGFTACVMAAGYNERKSYANVTVDWMAYQGAPVGGVTGELRMSQWWTGTTCATVKFPTVSCPNLQGVQFRVLYSCEKMLNNKIVNEIKYKVIVLSLINHIYLCKFEEVKHNVQTAAFTDFPESIKITILSLNC